MTDPLSYDPLMSQAARRRTFDELYEAVRALPEGLTGEILDPGVIETMSRPGRRHRRVAKVCAHALAPYDADRGGTGWWIEQEAEVRFPDERLVVPDLTGWRVDRVPTLPDENPIPIVPDFCCEVLSPTTAKKDVGVKLPLFARFGVSWVWLIDPDRRLLEIFETVAGRPTLAAAVGDDDRVTLPPFGVEVLLSAWWEVTAG